MEEPPEDWRVRKFTSDNGLTTEEKEKSLNFPNDKQHGIIFTDVATIMKWIASIEESEALGVRTNSEGEIIGVKARIPKGIVKLQGDSRKSKQSLANDNLRATQMTTEHECSRCGSENIDREIGGAYKDWVCQECGLTVVGGKVVEEQERESEYNGVDEEL